MEFKYWVLCGVVIVCYGFIKWIGAFISNKVISKIEEIIMAIYTLTNETSSDVVISGYFTVPANGSIKLLIHL